MRRNDPFVIVHGIEGKGGLRERLTRALAQGNEWKYLRLNEWKFWLLWNAL